MKKTDKTAVLPGFMEKNAAATEPMLYVLNTIILSFCIQACLYLASLNFCVTFGELKSKKIKTTCLLTQYFLQSQPY